MDHPYGNNIFTNKVVIIYTIDRCNTVIYSPVSLYLYGKSDLTRTCFNKTFISKTGSYKHSHVSCVQFYTVSTLCFSVLEKICAHCLIYNQRCNFTNITSSHVHASRIICPQCIVIFTHTNS